MFDGIFTSHLINELKSIENVRINRVNTITEREFFLTLSTKDKLLISVNSNSMHLRLTKMDLVNNPIKYNFHQTLKKYLESSIINNISQYHNERIIIFDITHFDELGYLIPIKLILELFGRNSNIILTDNDYKIIDCYKREFESPDSSLRIILPKAQYNFPISDKLNPFNETIINDINNYEGISNLLFTQLIMDKSFNRIKEKVNPVIITNDKKRYFYCFDLPYLEGDRQYFKTISEMLEYYYVNLKKDVSLNDEQIYLKNYILKEIKKTNEKIAKQENELQDAYKNKDLERVGNLLASNLHLVNKGDKEIIVDDYYNNNEKFKITLDPLLSPKKNLENIFNKYQKSKRAIVQINNQIELAKNDIIYYNCLLNQLEIAKINDIYEIYKELDLKKEVIKKQAKKTKPNITTYHTYTNDIIYVGKNNIQNNYITHTLADKTDYFFHVQGVPGSHVVVRTQYLSDELKALAGAIAAYYSTYRNATNVCVDYTMIKNIKKVPGMKGSFVIYHVYQSIFAKPDLEYIKANTKN